MKHQATILILGAVALLGTGIGSGYWYAMQHMQAGPVVQPQKPPVTAADKDDKSGPPSDRKVLYWHDPMVPGPRFDQPGKSPFMDMQLPPGRRPQTARDRPAASQCAEGASSRAGSTGKRRGNLPAATRVAPAVFRS